MHRRAMVRYRSLHWGPAYAALAEILGGIKRINDAYPEHRNFAFRMQMSACRHAGGFIRIAGADQAFSIDRLMSVCGKNSDQTCQNRPGFTSDARSSLPPGELPKKSI